MLLKILILFPLFAFSASIACAHVLGTSGRTYSIKERDALDEITERAGKADVNKRFDREMWEKKIKEYSPRHIVSLPAATEDRSFLVDTTYVLEFDISDGKGGILYPKGFTFNLLEYVSFTRTIVVINGKNRSEIDWFKGSEYFKDINAMVLLSEGSWHDVSRDLNRPVYYLMKPVADRFAFKHTPSVVAKKGGYMEVKEFYVKGENNVD